MKYFRYRNQFWCKRLFSFKNIHEIITEKEDFYKVKSEFEKKIEKFQIFWYRMEAI